ncbi:phosphate ABC transporter permease PstA [Kiritimatiellota bacterium B12222]|nr:phosphate ABC transporter permease PstA [Kiritimatiellota bacterium B12222]
MIDSDSSLEMFRHRRTPAKSVQSFFFWLFRICTYIIVLAASTLFIKIAYEGSITIFEKTFPFVNVGFFTQSPQTLYVFEWDDAMLTESKLEAVAAVEAEIRKEIPEKELFFKDAIVTAEAQKAETLNELALVRADINRVKKELKQVQRKEDAATKVIEKLEAKQQRLFDRNAPEAELHQMRNEIIAGLEARKAIFREKAGIEEERANLASMKNQLSAQLPEALEIESKRVLDNLQASLAWPEPGYFEKQNAEEAQIQAEFDGKELKLEEKYSYLVDRATAKAEVLFTEVDPEDPETKLAWLKAKLSLKKAEDRWAAKLEKLETERKLALTNARSFQAGDTEYRGVYARKAEAAGVNVKSYAYSGGGIFPAIVGTILLTVGSMTIALILGIFSAIYLSEYAKPGKVLNLIRLSIVNLAGVPSIVFGLFGFGMFVVFFGWGVSLAAGCFTLAFMVLPVIITSSEEAIRAVPQGFREGSLALGATKWTSIRTNVLPYALPGILTSSVLGVARVAGETAPIMFTAAYALRDNLPWEGLDKPTDFFVQGVMALPYHIYVVSSKIPQNEYTVRMQYGTAFVFLLIVACIAFTSILLRIRMRKLYKW